MNVLYKDLESLDVLEQLEDKKYNFIYLEIPYIMESHDFSSYEREVKNEISIRHYLAKSKGKLIGEVTIEEVKKEHDKWEKRGLKKFSTYISKVIENTYRLLKDDGIMAFLAPMHEYTKLDYKLILDQFFPSITNVTISHKTLKIIYDEAINSNYLLYFCSKINDFSFPILMKYPPIKGFPYSDEHGAYIKNTAYYPTANAPLHQYVWHGIIPPKNTGWKYSKSKMDKLYLEDRIIIEKENVFIKSYRSDIKHLEPISAIWEYTEHTKIQSSDIDSQSIDRMFSMFVETNSNILCPYDRDGKFSWMADKISASWTSICPPNYPIDQELFSAIPPEHYITVKELKPTAGINYQEGIITGVDDIYELKRMCERIREIQLTVGAASPEEAINEIHALVEASTSESSISACIPEAQEWLSPYWDKLEPESQHFIPTGVALYNQLINDSEADMAASLIEYCKSLEQELFRKLFYSYVNNLRDRNINIKDEFPEAFDNDASSIFANFLQTCLSRRNKNHPEKWEFELGKMRFVLEQVLSKDSNEKIFNDFRLFLDSLFDQKFFRQDFCFQLDRIAKLRNDCAHPRLITPDSVTEGKEIIREKILVILENYEY